MRPINRPAAILPVNAMQTYQVTSPRTTHTRPATCAEVGCKQSAKGWITTVPVGSPQEAMLNQVLRGHSPDGLRRKGKKLRNDLDAPLGVDPNTISFWFEPGTPCFKASTHRKKLDRPELFLVRHGDWRGGNGLIRRHTGVRAGEHWVEDMQETLDAVARRAGAR
jgi:hypothetical protein